MGSITQETLSVSGILLAKVFGRQAHEIDRYRVENAHQAAPAGPPGDGRAIVLCDVTQAFFGISPALVYLVAGLHGTSGDLSAGTLVAFTTLQTRLLMPINQLLQVSVDVQSSLALFGRIFELIDLRPPITDRPDALTLTADEIRGEVALDERHLPLRRRRGGRPSRRVEPALQRRLAARRARPARGAGRPLRARARRRSPTWCPGSTTCRAER